MSNKPFAEYENEAFELLQRLATQGNQLYSEVKVGELCDLAHEAELLATQIRRAKDERLSAAGGIKGLSRSTEGKKGKDNGSDY